MSRTSLLPRRGHTTVLRESQRNRAEEFGFIHLFVHWFAAQRLGFIRKGWLSRTSGSKTHLQNPASNQLTVAKINNRGQMGQAAVTLTFCAPELH